MIEDDVMEMADYERDERFVIDDDGKAEWAIRKIAMEEAERDRLIAVCQEQIDEYVAKKVFYEKRCESRTANLRAMLRDYFRTVPVRETQTQRKYELPSGALIEKKARRELKPDSDRLRDWLAQGGMDKYLKTEVSPKWALVKKQLAAAPDGAIVFGETGEILPEGVVTIEETPAKFEVKTK